MEAKKGLLTLIFCLSANASDERPSVRVQFKEGEPTVIASYQQQGNFQFPASDRCPSSESPKTESESNSPSVSYVRNSPRNQVTSEHVFNILFGQELYEPSQSMMDEMNCAVSFAKNEFPNLIAELSNNNQPVKESAALELFSSALHLFHEKTGTIESDHKERLKSLRKQKKSILRCSRLKTGGVCFVMILCWLAVPAMHYFAKSSETS